MKMFKLAVIALMFAGLLPHGSAQMKPPAAVVKELEAAETKMFASIVTQEPDYMKNFVAEDYFSIDADGVTETKPQLMAQKDSPKLKMMAAATVKLFDKQIRVYGNVGLITGRARAYMGDAYVAEFLYTAVFVKQNDKWMFTHWQGTISKDSPPPPPFPKS